MSALETWKPIPGWEGYYEASDLGRIRSVDRTITSNGGTIHYKGQLLAIQTSPGGYNTVGLRRGRKLHTRTSVHRLVAETFLKPDPMRPSVNHIDNDRCNNCLPNLEWCTQKENLDHARRQGRMADQTGFVRTRSAHASLTDDQVVMIRQEHAESGLSHGALARRHGLKKSVVGRLLRRETYADV